MQTMSNKVVLLLVVGVLGCGTSVSTPSSQGEAKTGSLRPDDKPAPVEPTSTDVGLDKLDGVEPLRAMFNADTDKVRVIALLEPG
jgi:hypothetical protein